MSDLIDRTNLIRILNEENVPFNASVNSIIISMPTIDAVQVVRCNDCKWFHKYEGFRWGDCKLTAQNVSIMDYCSAAERNEEDGTR